MLRLRTGRPGMLASARTRAVAVAAGLVVTLVGSLTPGRAGAQVAPAASPPPQGAVTGYVRDATGAAVPEARVSIEALARQVRSGADGSFTIAGLPVGSHEIAVRKLGFREARAMIPIIADSTINIGIVLVASPQQLGRVVVEAGVLNQVTGTVFDELDRPVPGVVIEVLGLDRQVMTQEDGRFLLLDLKPGSYLLQFRKPGYRVGQYGLRMVAEIERDISHRMRPLGDSRFTPELAEIVAVEANRRQGMRGAQARMVGRDELERWGNQPLDLALQGTSAGVVIREVNSSCLLINGHEPASVDNAGSGFRGITTRRGPTTIMNGGGGRGAPSVSLPRTASGGWLGFFRANEVELVEVYPVGTENSRTFCGRFPPSSGCSCPPDPSGIVIWLRN